MIATEPESVKSFIKLDEEETDEIEMESGSSDESETETGSPKVPKKKVPNVISGSKASVDDQVIVESLNALIKSCIDSPVIQLK
jgi:hypothetical protein